MKKLLAGAAVLGAAYAGLAAYASREGRQVGEVAGDLVNRGIVAAEGAADRLMEYAETLVPSSADALNEEDSIDLTDDSGFETPLDESTAEAVDRPAPGTV